MKLYLGADDVEGESTAYYEMLWNNLKEDAS